MSDTKDKPESDGGPLIGGLSALFLVLWGAQLCPFLLFDFVITFWLTDTPNSTHTYFVNLFGRGHFSGYVEPWMGKLFDGWVKFELIILPLVLFCFLAARYFDKKDGADDD